MTLIVGLTGGIGSGKSTVAQFFADRGVPIIDADVISRELTAKNQPAYLQICQHFADQDLVLSNGELDRRKLRDIIFTNPRAKEWLENLLHPLINSRINQQIAKIRVPYCIVAIPLLFESKHSYAIMDRVLVVDTPEKVQLERASIRDKEHSNAINQIMQHQISRNERLRRATDVINNDGNLEDLELAVDKLHKMYERIAKG